MLVFLLVFCFGFHKVSQAIECQSEQKVCLVLQTAEGNIVIELLPDAAPNAVASLIRLVEGPIFDAALTQNNLRLEPAGYYEGLEFDRALRNHYLSTAVRYPRDAILIETEIDAVALGLDERKIKDFPEAMGVWQREIMPFQTKIRRDEEMHPLLKKWLKQWAETTKPDFLVGVSRKTINEVLGYHYREGLPSRHVVRGSVTLEQLTPRWSTPRLTINFNDRPDEDGRQMVVGRVIQGFELAESFSTRKLTPVKVAFDRPLVPVRILHAVLECRDTGNINQERKGGSS